MSTVLRRLIVALVLGAGAIGAGSVRTDRTTQPERTPATATPARGTLLFADDFDGENLDGTRWNRCHWWAPNGCTIASNHEQEWYLPEQVSQSDGVLRLTAQRQPTVAADGTEYPFRSGMVTTGRPSSDPRAVPKFAFRYGRLEARVRMPSGDGLWPALWLLPASNASRPEIDVFEVRGSHPDRLSMHVHPADRGTRALGQHWAGDDLSVDWHLFTLDWQPGSLRWSIDGNEAWNVAGGLVPSEPMYLVANLAVGGDFPGPPKASTVFPATLELDYVKVWELI